MKQTAFHVDCERSKEKQRAAARSVVGMWEAEDYEEHSEFLDFPKRMVTPKPYQYLHPPAIRPHRLFDACKAACSFEHVLARRRPCSRYSYPSACIFCVPTRFLWILNRVVVR